MKASVLAGNKNVLPVSEKTNFCFLKGPQRDPGSFGCLSVFILLEQDGVFHAELSRMLPSSDVRKTSSSNIVKSPMLSFSIDMLLALGPHSNLSLPPPLAYFVSTIVGLLRSVPSVFIKTVIQYKLIRFSAKFKAEMSVIL